MRVAALVAALAVGILRSPVQMQGGAVAISRHRREWPYELAVPGHR